MSPGDAKPYNCLSMCHSRYISHTPDLISSNLEEIMHLINVFPRFEITVIGPKGGLCVSHLFVHPLVTCGILDTADHMLMELISLVVSDRSWQTGGIIGEFSKTVFFIHPKMQERSYKIC